MWLFGCRYKKKMKLITAILSYPHINRNLLCAFHYMLFQSIYLGVGQNLMIDPVEAQRKVKNIAIAPDIPV